MDAHEREGDAAAAAMVEQYGEVRIPERGQWIRGTSRGRRFSGEVAEVRGRWVVIEIDGFVAVVALTDIEWD